MSSVLRIVGPPGTGKTTRLEQGIRRSVALSSMANVYVATLTKAGATEITDRSVPLAKGNAGTIHHHAYQALGLPALTAGKEGEWNLWIRGKVAAWQLSSVKEADDDLEVVMDTPDGKTEGDKLMARVDVLRARMAPEMRWGADEISFRNRWNEWKAEEGLMDFTDLIEQALHDVPRLHNSFAFVVDEAQDSSRLEMALCRQWGGQCVVYVTAGDPDQAIFTWRGADPEAFWEGEARTEVLEQSYRLPRAVHAEAVRWIEQCHHRVNEVNGRPIAYLPRVDEKTKEVVEGKVTRSSATLSSCLSPIESYVARGKTVMVLATCAYMLTPVIRQLREAGIPFHNPYRRRQGAWNPLWSSRGVSARDRLLALLHPREPDRKWKPREVLAWAGAVRGMPKASLEAVKALPQEAEMSIEELFDLLPEDRQAWPWFTESLLLTEFEKALLAGKKDGMVFPLQVARRHGAMALEAEPLVTVGTVHSVKGGQADVVLVAPDLSIPAYEQWQGGGEGQDAVRRVLYVAQTRAREELVLLSSDSGMRVRW